MNDRPSALTWHRHSALLIFLHPQPRPAPPLSSASSKSPAQTPGSWSRYPALPATVSRGRSWRRARCPARAWGTGHASLVPPSGCSPGPSHLPGG
ncbi:hypothetical protein MBAV_002461 [Candidatus Magnetobacterium bavaricum]|uniref:Uncharacterized protein n=1 Tax=Candidatus Magnetobacterium bavaricum TaxID=29290 RepID=A0A0F3GU32_9BACT|nr:hypothetical protein MBAV_002461 [Candidatus Magnetobacterium bavaricum]